MQLLLFELLFFHPLSTARGLFDRASTCIPPSIVRRSSSVLANDASHCFSLPHPVLALETASRARVQFSSPASSSRSSVHVSSAASSSVHRVEERTTRTTASLLSRRRKRELPHQTRRKAKARYSCTHCNSKTAARVESHSRILMPSLSHCLLLFLVLSPRRSKRWTSCAASASIVT